MRLQRYRIALMLATALFMTSCRSSKSMLEQRQTERVNDTVRQTVLVFYTLREQVTVCDTLRETTTITLNAEGDTVRKETEREHVSDRSRERASASHEGERASDEKQTIVEQPKAKHRDVFQWGVVAGFLCGIISTFGTFRLIRKFRK